ncbi:hypothetical protein [Streptomyces mashuensis]|nr:hypothetical protein [Streptomyces mashuensis]
MLDQRTPLPTRKTAVVPSADELSLTLRKVAGFLESIPGLPSPSVTVHTGDVLVQFSFLPSHVLFPAVARVAAVMGVTTQLRPMSDGNWHFEARGQAQGLCVTVFAAVTMATDPVRVAWGVA